MKIAALVKRHHARRKTMPIRTRLTDRLGIAHPILSAPMGFVAGGRLAAAVTAAGGLGLIGGGYGDAEWLEREFKAAGNARVGCGFITWSLAKEPRLLDLVLAHAPAAVMLSFDSPAPFAAAIKAGGAQLICQVQSMASAREAVDVGADIIVAQGGEAGGHAEIRSTFTLVPEVADYVAKHAPETLLVAAGGIADGRGLAAALMLGAEGVLVGSRFLASPEALLAPALQDAILRADGDATVKTRALDIVRSYQWPPRITGRALRNRFVDDWHDREGELAVAETRAREFRRYTGAREAGDANNTGIFVGEAAGLINEVTPAGDIVSRIVAEAERALTLGG
jgi:nitronate monooxygenase